MKVPGATGNVPVFGLNFAPVARGRLNCPYKGLKLLSSRLQWTGPSTVLPVRCWSRNVPLSRAARPARPRPPVATASRQNVSIQHGHILFFACRIGLFISQEIDFSFSTQTALVHRKVSSAFQFKGSREPSIIKGHSVAGV